MKIVVVGLGYVGMSNAVLLAQYNEVIGVDISHERVDALNARQSLILDTELSEYLARKDLNLSASTDLKASLNGAAYVIVSTPMKTRQLSQQRQPLLPKISSPNVMLSKPQVSRDALPPSLHKLVTHDTGPHSY